MKNIRIENETYSLLNEIYSLQLEKNPQENRPSNNEIIKESLKYYKGVIKNDRK